MQAVLLNKQSFKKTNIRPKVKYLRDGTVFLYLFNKLKAASGFSRIVFGFIFFAERAEYASK